MCPQIRVSPIPARSSWGAFSGVRETRPAFFLNLSHFSLYYECMGMNEADTRAKLIDPAIHSQGWTEDLIKREESAGAIQIIEGKARKQARGRIDYTLRIKVNTESQPVAD